MYLDEATERVETERQADFESAVIAVQSGTVFAHNGSAYRRWRSRIEMARTRLAGAVGLTGMALEQRIAQLRRDRPDIVAVRR